LFRFRTSQELASNLQDSVRDLPSTTMKSTNEASRRKRQRTEFIDLLSDSQDDDKAKSCTGEGKECTTLAVATATFIGLNSSSTSSVYSTQGAWLRHELRNQMQTLIRDQPNLCCFGSVGKYSRASGRSKNGTTRSVYLRLPLEGADKSNSWFRVIDSQIISKLGNNPTDHQMCWLYRLPDFATKMTDQKSMAKKKEQNDPYGGGSKMTLTLGSGDHQHTGTWKLHRVVHAMYNPRMFDIVGNFQIPDRVHLAHRCGYGARGFPWEITVTTCASIHSTCGTCSKHRIMMRSFVVMGVSTCAPTMISSDRIYVASGLGVTQVK